MNYSLKASGIALKELRIWIWGPRDYIQGAVLHWLFQEIGPYYGNNPKWQFEYIGDLLYFKREEDKVKFILRWL